MRNFCIILSFLSLTSGLSFAQSAESREAVCSPKNAKDLLDCVLKRAPSVREAALDLKSAEADEDAASAWTNPELDTTTTFGDNFGVSEVTTEIGLKQTFSIGGARSSRIRKAESSKFKAQASQEETRFQTTTDLVVNLHRLRQLRHEYEAFDEALNTFKGIQQQYKSRGRLGPEHSASLFVFDTAYKEASLNRLHVLEEETRVKQSIEIAIGQKIDWSAGILPRKLTSWPQPPTTLESPQPPDLKIAKAELGVAKAELGVARGESWPEITLGPVFERKTQGADEFYSGGVALSLPLPLWNWNGGARASARAGMEKAQIRLDIKEQTLRAELQRTLAAYQMSRKELEGFGNVDQLEKRHIELEGLFARGLVTSSLVIESHRQILDFFEKLHETEVLALEQLMRLRIMSGSLEVGDLLQ